MDNQLALFIGMLLEADNNRNFMRMRDEIDPLDMPDSRFVQMFRLDKQSALNLIHSVRLHIPDGGNINSISTLKKVLITLNFLSVGSYQNSVGTNVWLSASQTTVSRSIAEVCLVITEHLLPQWVKFPTNNEDTLAVKREYFVKYGLRGVLTAVDGTHVEIIAPSAADENHPPFVYINRKGKHSINVMLISDANNKILSCNARFPGSVHDSAVWQSSTVRRYLYHQYRNPQEEAFNTNLTSARNVIERTNGIIKGRFRTLIYYYPVKAANIIYTCCVLHNIALSAGVNFNQDKIEYPLEEIIEKLVNLSFLPYLK